MSSSDAIKKDLLKSPCIQVEYNSGLKIYANFSDQPWLVKEDNHDYSLPKYGTLAVLPGSRLFSVSSTNPGSSTGKLLDKVYSDHLFYIDTYGEVEKGEFGGKGSYMLKKEKFGWEIIPLKDLEEVDFNLSLIGFSELGVDIEAIDKNGNIMKDKSGKVVHEPYVIKVLNTINFSKSLHYNPFAYIRSEKDILKLVTTIIVNTKGEGEKASEDFWVKAEKLLYTALIAFIWYEGDEEEKNLNTLLDLLNESETREEDETYQNPVDMMFQELEERDPQHFAVRQYKKYKMAAGKTAKSILISCGARLAPFDIAELREIMSYDEMELDKIGDRKTALFLIMSDTDTTFNFVIAMLQSQLFNLLCDKADDEYGGRLPVHVRVIADEFANIGQIPQFDKLIATIRSREISASIILQSQSQLKAMYKDSADTILGNCDTTLFLGGKEKTTLKEMSELLGKETIDLYNTSETRSNQKSFGLNYQKTGKQLMTEDEIAVMDGGKCILQIRGARPFFSDKYDITKHKNYRLLADENEKNRYKVEKELNPQYTPKPEEEVEVIHVELSE